MNTLTTSSVVRRANDVFSANIDTELVMMRLESNGYFGLDAISGWRIWNCSPRRARLVLFALHWQPNTMSRRWSVRPTFCASWMNWQPMASSMSRSSASLWAQVRGRSAAERRLLLEAAVAHAHGCGDPGRPVQAAHRLA